MTDQASFQTDPKWAAQITAEEEREARAWLKGQIGAEIVGGPASTLILAHLRTIQRLLARPVMPEKLTREELIKIYHDIGRAFGPNAIETIHAYPVITHDR